jgi:hypothetical protein
LGQIDSCLRALVNSAIERGQLLWLCSLQPQDSSRLQVLAVVEDQLQVLARSSDLAAFLSPKKKKEEERQGQKEAGPPNYHEVLLAFYLCQNQFRRAGRLLHSCYLQLLRDADFSSGETAAAAMAACAR